MKTKRIITAIAAILLIAMTGILNAQSISQMPAVKGQTGDPISYTVQITNPGVLNGDKNTWMICMKDGAGRLVAPAQIFRPGKNWYEFFEKGPVRGTRAAQMVCVSENIHSWSAFSARSGYWYPSTCYLFMLTLQPGPEPVVNNKE